MRADRLLSILLLLQSGRRQTARALAERLEVSERTILRDMEALCAAGVPVVAERGAGGGWRMPAGYRTDLTGLNSAEIQTLFFAKSSRLLGDLGLDKAADAAVIKLLAALPSIARQGVDFTRERLHIDGAGWYQSSEAFPLLSLVQQAIWQEKKLAMVYRRGDDTTSQRQVNPLGLVAKGSVWYLVASHEEGLRSYRVSRIVEAAITNEPSVRPDGFDLATYWEQSVAQFKASVPRYPATLRVSPEMGQRIHRSRLPVVCEQPPAEDGWTEMTVLFEVEHEACEYLMRAGAHVMVLEPPELRERVRATAAAIIALYR
ncbi:MAG TPA: YafY family protein [Capsulimonadaceae bacterium]|nr:YafY family protein [Capsulimonadaceae bacterium]